jgi:3-oxoacyl-[acyl-carrier-protein] synthase II
MTMAMADAGVDPQDIGYVNAHGTSTPAGDSAETRALKIALGEERAFEVPVSSTKSETGHLLGATGALEVAVTALAMRDGYLPPTINLDDPDDDLDLDVVGPKARQLEIPAALNNSFGFGGHNVALLFTRA